MSDDRLRPGVRTPPIGGDRGTILPPQSSRPGVDLTGGTASMVQCLRAALNDFDLPRHLFLPRDAFPFVEVQSLNDFGDTGNPGAANTRAEIVFHTVPENMNAHILYFGHDAEDFTPGLTEQGIDWFLLADDEGIQPFSHFRGILSPIPAPTSRGLINYLVRPGQRIHLDAQIRTTADGGLDDATADLTAVIAGWQFHVTRA